MLDIIVPHYKEPWSIGKKFFTMLNLQRGIDFDMIHVIIINDGEENELPQECFKECPYKVTQINIPHSGVSAARNKGIEAATAEWIRFCDFDDMFSNVYALRQILSVLQKTDKNIVVNSYFIEKYTLDHQLTVKTLTGPSVEMLHGFFIRREHLINSGVRFDTGLTYGEDFDFMLHLSLSTPIDKTGQIENQYPPYIYCLNDESVTSKADSYDEKMKNLFIGMKKQCSAYLEKGFIADYRKRVVNTIYTMYRVLNVTELDDNLCTLTKDFASWYKEHKGALEHVKDSEKFVLWDRAKEWSEHMKAVNTIEWYSYMKVPLFNEEKKFEDWTEEILSLTK